MMVSYENAGEVDGVDERGRRAIGSVQSYCLMRY